MYPKAEVLLVFLYGTIAEIFDVGGKFFAIGVFFPLLNLKSGLFSRVYILFLTTRVTIGVFQQLEKITLFSTFSSKSSSSFSFLFRVTHYKIANC